MKSPYKTRVAFSAVASVILALAIAVGVATGLNNGMSELPIRQYFPASQTNAIWDWSNITNYDSGKLHDTASFLRLHQINTVYIDIGSYGETIAAPASAERTERLNKLTAALEKYNAAMSADHIRTFAAAGNTDWSMADKQAIPLAIQQYVFDYNKSHATKLAGLEFDIEAYNQTNFAKASMTEKSLVLMEYLDLVDRLATAQSNYAAKVDHGKMELGFAIPYWFDDENHNIESVNWHDKVGPTLYHLMDRLNELPSSNVDVMAYRNAASGNDGMIYHSRTEVEYAKSQAPHVKVLIGMEMNNVEPAKITFYGQSYEQITSQAKLLNTEFGTSGFKGVAINDLAGYRAIAGTTREN